MKGLEASLTRKSAILFDFDYTLADSSPAIVECTQVALAAMDLPSVTEDSICRTIGLSLPETLIALAGEEHRQRAEEFRAHYRVRSDQIMVARTTMFSGVRETVSELRTLGLRVGIVSTKYRLRIEAVLARDGLSDLFDLIIGGEDVTQVKPHPEGLLRALEGLDAAPGQGLYVGDSRTDAETARQAGVDFVAVLSGMTRQEEFESYPTIAIIENIRSLATMARAFDLLPKHKKS